MWHEYGRFDDLLAIDGYNPVKKKMLAYLREQFEADMKKFLQRENPVSLLGKNGCHLSMHPIRKRYIRQKRLPEPLACMTQVTEKL